MLDNVIILRLSMMFCVTVICDKYVAVTFDVILILNSKSKNKKIKRKENRNEK